MSSTTTPADQLAGGNRPGRLPMLDGVRALSIVAVLVAHLLPVRIDGESWNNSVGLFGMALFFVLSGYLITEQLLHRLPPLVFAVRRLLRIVPLAWLCIALVWLCVPMDERTLLSNLLFYANLPPALLVHPLEHFWSLCVEVQFYLLALALLCVKPRWTWYVLPVLLLASTGLRLFQGVTASSVSWYRADDLLAGAVLALVLNSGLRERLAAKLGAFDGKPAGAEVLVWSLIFLLGLASILPKAGENWLSYLRPYCAAAFVGVLILRPGLCLSRWFSRPAPAYVASISYALYVWHLPLAATWLGSGDLLEKYLKRPLLFLVLLALAHVSTFYFERRFMDWGKRLGASRPARPSRSS